MTILSLVPRACVQASRTIAEHLIFRPLQGLWGIFHGIAQAVPDLFRAASEAVVDAVASRLYAKARANVCQGTDRVLAGAKLLIAPIGVVIGFWAFLHPGVIYLGCAAWLVIIATGMAI